MSMHPSYLTIGDTVAASPVGAGTITNITDAGFPQVDHIAVSWLERTDGAVFDPFGVRDKHLAPVMRTAFRRLPADDSEGGIA